MSSIACQSWCNGVWDPRIDQLARNPQPRGYRRLEGSDLYRIRVGDYRVVYGINDAERFVVVTAVRHRSRAYRGLR